MDEKGAFALALTSSGLLGEDGSLVGHDVAGDCAWEPVEADLDLVDKIGGRRWFKYEGRV
jgi:hypothetical protein